MSDTEFSSPIGDMIAASNDGLRRLSETFDEAIASEAAWRKSVDDRLSAIEALLAGGNRGDLAKQLLRLKNFAGY